MSRNSPEKRFPRLLGSLCLALAWLVLPPTSAAEDGTPPTGTDSTVVRSLVEAALVAGDAGDAIGKELNLLLALPLLEKIMEAEKCETARELLVACLASLCQLAAGDPARRGEALEFGERALSLLAEMENPDADVYLKTINLACAVSVEGHDAARAEAWLEKALVRAKERRDAGRELRIRLAVRLAELKSNRGDREGSAFLLREALADGEAAWGNEDERLSPSLLALGRDLAVHAGDYAEAEQVVRRCLAISERNQGKDGPGVVEPLTLLGKIANWRGDYRAADPLLRRALLAAAGNDPDGPGEAAALAAWAESLFDRGDLPGADEAASRAIAIRRKLGGVEYSDLFETVRLYASIKFARGANSAGLAFIEEIIALAEVDYGDAHPGLAQLHADAAFIAESLREKGKAFSHYNAAARLAEKNLPESHPLRLFIAGAAAEFQLFQGEVEPARLELLHAWELASESLGDSHPITGDLAGRFALACVFSGDNGEALTAAGASERTTAARVAAAFAVSSERQRLAFASWFPGDLRLYAPLVLANLALLDIPERDGAAAAYAGHLLRTKGMVLDSFLEDRTAALATPEGKEALERLNHERSFLAQLLLAPPDGATGREDYRLRTEKAREETERLERELAEISGQTVRRAALASPGAVAGVLPAGSALIEFSTFLHLPGPSGSESSASGPPPIRYIAAVILSGDAKPKIIAFAAKSGIDELIVRVRDGMRDGSAVHDDLRKLHDLIWVPLSPSLGDNRRIFISPSGELNFLSFAALVTPERRYLGEEFTLSYVASGRDLLRHPAMDGIGAAIFADPDFSAIPVPGGARAADVPEASGSGTAYHFLFGQGGRLVAAGMKFPSLPSTRTEAESLRRIFTAAGHAPDVWLGADATKARVRALRRPAIVHFATHGFFLPTVGGMTGRFLVAGGETDAFGESSLFRSGLALAGAAAALTGTTGEEGILTAGEAASLDLRGTRLVVLSACDSGTGDLAGDEIIGFRRAFVQAGVGDMLLALWPVEDRTTAGIMRGFYEYYLRGLPADLALARAQRDGMAVRRSAGGRLHPRFWAPFVVSFQGSPRPE